LRVNLRAPADENLASRQVRRQAVQLPQVRNPPGAWMGKTAAAQDQRDASRQWFADGLESLAAHDEDVAGGDSLEPLEILRQMPRNLPLPSDHAV
jgi:hypothetical protein